MVFIKLELYSKKNRGGIVNSFIYITKSVKNINFYIIKNEKALTSTYCGCGSQCKK